MLVIRLQRTGRQNSPSYRVVVAEHSMPVKGRVKEIVGHYLPTREPIELTVDEERIAHWISLGASPSNTVARLLTNNGMKGLEKYMKSYTKKKKKGESEEDTAATTSVAESAPKSEDPDEGQKEPVEVKKEAVPAKENAEVPADDASEKPVEESPKIEPEKPEDENSADEKPKEEPKKAKEATEESPPSQDAPATEEGDNEKKA